MDDEAACIESVSAGMPDSCENNATGMASSDKSNMTTYFFIPILYQFCKDTKNPRHMRIL